MKESYQSAHSGIISIDLIDIDIDMETQMNRHKILAPSWIMMMNRRGKLSRMLFNCRADMVFFCLFPLLFLVFNLIYWWSVIQWREETWNTFRSASSPFSSPLSPVNYHLFNVDT